MSTREGDHGRATYHLRTGYVQQPPIDFPPLGAALAKEMGDPEADLPNFISIAPAHGVNPSAFGAGFLGPRFAPLMVGEDTEGGTERALRVQDMGLPRDVRPDQAETRFACRPSWIAPSLPATPIWDRAATRPPTEGPCA